MELVVDGRKAFAATGGVPFDPARPAIVLVHGAGMDHSVWQLQCRYLAHHGWAALAVDLPGHGRSAGPPLTGIELYADWLAAFIAATGLVRAALVGHSMGALIVLEAAARQPDKVAALALLGVALRMPVHPELLAAAERQEAVAFDLITAWGYGKPAHLGGHPAPGHWMLGSARRLLELGPPGVLGADLHAANAYQGGRAAAERVACPALIILGEVDRMTSVKAGREVAALIPGARAVTLQGCGHMMMVERPDATLDALRDFLWQTGAAATAGP